MVIRPHTRNIKERWKDMKTYLQKHDKINYSDHWYTPKEIYDLYVIQKNYHDPCPLFSAMTDLLTLNNNPQFINPPYSNISLWVDYAIACAKEYHQHIVLLIPSRTDTKYFHSLLEYGVDLEFIKGRLKFGCSKYGAPFPSVLVHLNKGE